MAITRKPKKTADKSQLEVEKLINKGGSVAKLAQSTSPDKAAKEKQVALRVPAPMLADVDNSVKQRAIRIPRPQKRICGRHHHPLPRKVSHYIQAKVQKDIHKIQWIKSLIHAEKVPPLLEPLEPLISLAFFQKRMKCLRRKGTPFLRRKGTPFL